MPSVYARCQRGEQPWATRPDRRADRGPGRCPPSPPTGSAESPTEGESPMSRSSRSFRPAAAVACGLALAVPLLPTPAVAADPPWTTVASGLDSPRQLSFTGDTLYVAE